MSQYASELCQLLIKENFGELYSNIFSALAHHGRLSLSRVVFHTRLSPTQVRYGLVVLVQQHLVYHHTSFDDGVTFYEANWQSAYSLVRSGKVLEAVKRRLGDYAAQVMSIILFLGHAQVGYLESLPELKPVPPKSAIKQAKSATNGVNGVHTEDDTETFPNGTDGHDETSQRKLHPTLRALASHGYIHRVREAQLHSPSDNRNDAEKAVSSRSDIKNLKGKRQQESIIEEVERMVKERTDGTVPNTGLSSDGLPRGVKRRHATNEDFSTNKRPKVEQEDGDDDDDDDFDDELDDVIPMDQNLALRVNYEKFNVIFRNRQLVSLAERVISPATAKVYETALTRIEYQTPRCRDTDEVLPEGEEGEQYSKGVSLHAICQDIDPSLDLESAIGPFEPSTDISQLNGTGKRPLPVEEEELEDDDEDEADDQDDEDGSTTKVIHVQQHLALLGKGPYVFTTRSLQSGMVMYRVEYRHLAKKLRHLELERIIEARFGTIALRVIRILLAKGRLDEKRLQEISLLATKDLRQVLGGLEEDGFVDLQEVPRDAQRQPSRTLYLWFYDPDRVRKSVLEDTYKAMSRCLRRIEVERDKLKSFLEKTERSDVKGNEEKYLSEAELKTLKEWRAKEAILLGEVGRLDDVVMALRDF